MFFKGHFYILHHIQPRIVALFGGFYSTNPYDNILQIVAILDVSFLSECLTLGIQNFLLVGIGVGRH